MDVSYLCYTKTQPREVSECQLSQGLVLGAWSLESVVVVECRRSTTPLPQYTVAQSDGSGGRTEA